MTESVVNAYQSNRNDSPKLPTCHNIAEYIIKRIGKKFISVYCYRYCQSKQGI